MPSFGHRQRLQELKGGIPRALLFSYWTKKIFYSSRNSSRDSILLRTSHQGILVRVLLLYKILCRPSGRICLQQRRRVWGSTDIWLQLIWLQKFLVRVEVEFQGWWCHQKFLEKSESYFCYLIKEICIHASPVMTYYHLFLILLQINLIEYCF